MSDLSACPFFAGGMLTDSRFFVGRDQEIGSVVRCMTGDQPRSINIVGDRHIGKSSLLWHICNTYEARISACEGQPQKFVVVYLSLKAVEQWGAERFYQEIVQCLRERVRDRHELSGALVHGNVGYAEFRLALNKWKQQRVLPVVCLDDFDTMVKHRKKFDDNFYDNLRSLLDSSLLMLVIASREPLRDQKRKYRYTSSFFNLFQLDRLGEFSTGEANRVLNFPIGQSTKLNSDPLPKSWGGKIMNKFRGKKQSEPLPSLLPVAVLSDDQQRLAIQWAGNHPYLLQLAGKCLYEAKQEGATEAWVKKKFDDNSKGVPRKREWGRITINGLTDLGRYAQYLGGLSGSWGKTISGIVVIILIAKVVLTGQNPNQLIDWGKKMVTDALNKGKVPAAPKNPEALKIKDSMGGQQK
jgi:uncharacterized protein